MRNHLPSRARGAALALLLLAAPAAFAASVDLVSRIAPPPAPQTASGGDGLAYFLDPPSVSADGRYAVFLSTAANLAPGQRDVNGKAGQGGADVFLADLATGGVTLVSHAMGLPATTGNDGSSLAKISADGRWVLFRSAATDLAPGQQTVFPFRDEDVLLYDRVTGATTLVASTRFEQTYFFDLDLSADGRYITYATEAVDLIPGQKPGYGGVYLYDRVSGSTRLATHLPGDPLTSSNAGGSYRPRISADGRYAAFLSYAPDLLPGQIAENGTAVLWDRVADTLTAVGPAEDVNLSADGKIVAFTDGGQLKLWSRETRATLVAGPGGGHDGSTLEPLYTLSADGRYVTYASGSLWVYDRVTRTTLEVKPAASPDNAVYSTPQISADGRFIAFMSTGSAWVSGQVDANAGRGDGSLDVFVYDLGARKALLVSHQDGSLKTTGNFESERPAISADGRRVVYYSSATDLVAGVTDTNGVWDLFACDVPSQANRLATPRAAGLVPLSGDAVSRAAALSPDGKTVAFERHSVAYSTQADLLLYDVASGSSVLVNHAGSSPTTAAKGVFLAPVFSGDGRYVAFLSNSRNLVPGANPNGVPAYYLFDRVTGAVTYVARAGSSSLFPDSGPALPRPSLSADGRWLAFVSDAPDLVPGQREQTAEGYTSPDVFLFDRQTGAITLVSHAAGDAVLAANAGSNSPVLSADGRYLAFLSGALDLLPGLTSGSISGGPGAYLYDRVTGSLTLLSHRRSTPQAVAPVYSRISMSTDGHYLAFATAAGDLDPGVPAGGDSIYLYDRVTGSYQWAGSAESFRQAVVLSADGRTVAFPGSFDGLFFYDRVTRATSKLAEASVEDGELALSADGRYAVYLNGDPRHVAVPGLIPLPGRNGTDLFLHDRTTGSTTLVNQWRGSAVTTGGYAEGPWISADGQRVAFTSQIDLVAGDYNRQRDAYLFSLNGSAGGGGPVTLPPCILLDTRRPADGPALRSNVARVAKATGACGVPATASRVTVKMTVFQGTGKGNVRLYPGDLSQPATGILRFTKGQTVTATFDAPLAPAAGTLTLLPFVAGNGTAGVSLEIDGYTP